jgi:DNA-binding transcriptional LysR family regulator
MTLRQLECFLAVVREGSFTRAAQRIHLSQPTLSQGVLDLEREVGKPLLARGRRRQARLTEAGRVFEPYAARILASVESGMQAVTELDGLRHGSLVVGASTTPGVYVLPRLIGQFRARYPGINLTLQIANSQAIEERVRAGHLDLGVVGGHVLGAGERCLAAGLVDELVLIVPRRHAWAKRNVIDAKRLREQPLLMREHGSATRHVTERALQQAGLRCQAAMELDHTEAIKQGVMAGLGVALVSIHAVQSEVAARHLVTLRVRGLHLRRHFHVIHDEERPLSASAETFARMLDPKRKRNRQALAR